jgi:hypothetical protein
MFWGAILKNEEEYKLKTNNRSRILHISHAALVKRGEKDKVMIQLCIGKRRFVIGILSTNQNEFINLNYNLQIDNKSEFVLNLINGNNTEVHISGFFERESEQSNGFEHNVISRFDNREVNEQTDRQINNSNSENGNGNDSEESNNEEVDPGVDTLKLTSFLHRKIGKSEEMKNVKGKKLKKLDMSSYKVSKMGTKEKPTLKNKNQKNLENKSLNQKKDQ